MRIRFYGVRGSLPAPLLPGQIRSRISAVLARLRPEDVASPDRLERFLAELPPWLFGSVGGNTPCVTLETGAGAADELIVFDAGTGLRELGIAAARLALPPRRYHLFLSHFHWDHVQGLPFFAPAYNPRVAVDFYSPKLALEAYLRGQMVPPYFPAPLDAMGAIKAFHTLDAGGAGGPMRLGGAAITWRAMGHPGDSFAYRVDDGKRRFIYATDAELGDDDFARTRDNIAFFSRADLIVLDSQYTTAEAAAKSGWGHSAYLRAVEFAAAWGIRRVALFHHDPGRDDQGLYEIRETARDYARRVSANGLEVILAFEGLEIAL